MAIHTAFTQDGSRFQARHHFTARTIGCRVPRTDHRGYVGAIFKHACLVLLEDGVIALLAPHVGQVAHGVRLAEDEPVHRWVWIGMPARICGSGIVLGADVVAVTLSATRIWTPAVRVGMCQWNQSTFKAMTLVRNMLLDLAPASNSEFLAATLQAGRPVTLLGARLSAVLPSLARAARTYDREGALRFLRELVGLGPGLTPAGDDFVIGWLAGLTLTAQSSAQRRFLAAICTGVEALSCATTPISRQHLTDSCALMFSEHLSDVCVAIASGASPPTLKSRLAAQVAVGATSGADAAAGLMFALLDCASSRPFSG